MKRRCAGYPPYDRCDREAGTPWSPYWCERCDKLRRAAITASLEQIAAAGRDEEIKKVIVRCFRETGRGAVHSVKVDEQGRPEGDYGALCGATVATLTVGDTLTLLHEVLPHTLTGKARCKRCQYVEAARGGAKAWERPKP